jgi:hypothetical protein
MVECACVNGVDGGARLFIDLRAGPKTQILAAATLRREKGCGREKTVEESEKAEKPHIWEE